MIRKANENDLEQIAKLYQTSFPEHIMVHKGILNNPSYLSEQIKKEDQTWVVDEKDGKIVGVAALAIAPPVGLGEIERVCVDNEFRGNGVALGICQSLVEEALLRRLGFVEAFARGDQPSMQRTFEKLGFKVYGVAPRFEVVHGGKIVREQFVHMGLELMPDTIDEMSMGLIPNAQRIYNLINPRNAGNLVYEPRH